MASAPLATRATGRILAFLISYGQLDTIDCHFGVFCQRRTDNVAIGPGVLLQEVACSSAPGQ